MYQSTNWKDNVVDNTTGKILQEGTEQSAGNFNKMEHGISDVHIATALTMIAVSQKEGA